MKVTVNDETSRHRQKRRNFDQGVKFSIIPAVGFATLSNFRASNRAMVAKAEIQGFTFDHFKSVEHKRLLFPRQVKLAIRGDTEAENQGTN